MNNQGVRIPVVFNRYYQGPWALAVAAQTGLVKNEFGITQQRMAR